MQVKLLIVDYDGKDRERITRSLKFSPLEILGIQIRDGLSALKALHDKKYEIDVILANDTPRYYGPDNAKPMTGLEFLKAIRADKDLQSIPFILIGVGVTEAELTAAKEAGVSYYLTEPAIPNNLTQAIKSALGMV